MELFTKGTAIRLRSCHEKYLLAADDEKSIRQSSDGTSRQSIWTVEMVPRKPNLIRLKSCYGKYLTASESSYLMGITGERVIQTPPFRQAEHESNWEPIRDDLQVKLMSWNGKYLRGNGGAPPWKNSVTHDHEPHTSATKRWILWSVEVVKNPDKVSDGFSDGSIHGLPVNKLPTFGSSESIESDHGSLATVSASKLMFTTAMSGSMTPKPAERKKTVENVSAIEIFRDAKSVRLRSSAHEKYLIADVDEESVTMGRNGSSKEARWRVELVPGSEKAVRLKSCHGGYLTASNERLMLGAMGHKVVQSRRIQVGEPAGEWEPVREGSEVKLKSRNGGNYMRANGGVPPWRNTVTHDSPDRSATQSWVVWEVDVIEIMERSNGTD
ncbi:hypothetical protein AALP_AA2G127800 [Arabis alpina]|uniref:DUF569 domain-containing protein n=1 Tax=Arabis alpina TaxID=50452 RepID=A0A087HH11_ARAAL|nr:hypothetical protein AALP_AA2G127800 [Arabis alpina]